jgi:hypothetical protein
VKLSLRSLVIDLEIRAEVARRSLEGAPKVARRSEDALASVKYIATETAHLLGEDLDGSPSQFYPAYQNLTRLMYERETLELPFILHFEEGSRRATRLCEELLANISWPYEPILVGTMSSQYYWTLPYWRIVATPSNEEKRLLGLGDLCHELGHTAYTIDDRKLVDDFPIALGKHLRGNLDSPHIPDGKDANDYLTEVFYRWQESWLQEFVCDLIACYLVGPAFLRQHARLRAMAQPNAPIFNIKTNSSHPADHARATACLLQLRKLGFDAQADRLEEVWGELVTSSGEDPMGLYHLLYPEALLELLAESVINGCASIGLRPYDPDADPTTDIPRLVNEAWARLEAAPGEYREWEEGALGGLWQAWGV